MAAATLAFPFGGVGDYRVPPQPVPPAAEVAAAAAGQSYGGATLDNEPIAIRVRGRQVIETVLELRASCDSGRTFPLSLTARRSPGKSSVPKLKGGRLSKARKFTASAVGGVDLGSQVAVASAAWGGTLTARRSVGAMLADVTVNDKASGQTVDHCSAAASKWFGTVPERRVYSGSSQQAEPVVLELSANRKRVTTFRFAFFADCTPTGSIAPADAITNFPIRKGRFGADFSEDGADGAGGTIHLDFSFHGRLSRARATGTLSVTAADRDAAGNTTSTCPSGPLKWSAQQ